jgi:hypothetical protein
LAVASPPGITSGYSVGSSDNQDRLSGRCQTHFRYQGGLLLSCPGNYCIMGAVRAPPRDKSG